MAVLLDRDAATLITGWVEEHARDRQITVGAYCEEVLADGFSLHVPVSVPDNIDRRDLADALQRIEDAWEAEEMLDSTLYLIPIGAEVPSPLDPGNRTMAELLDRQRDLLDSVERAADAGDMDRISALRLQWKQTVNALDRLVRA
ncbi:MAG: hypothetical protein ACLQVD_04325 [Capsulimonadaceae bacterium]